jgi:ABC-2 type transport system permease protein
MSHSEPTPSALGVIHDIGYRGYDGERLDRRHIRTALFTHSLRGVYGLGRSGKSKIIPFGLAAVMLLPALIIAVVNVALAGQGVLSEPVLPYTRYAMVLSAAITIFVGVQATQAVSLDLRFHTLPLYLSRPLSRDDYVRAKYAALSLGLFILIAVPILIMYTGSLFAEFPVGRETGDAALALAGAMLYALVLAGIALVIASTTTRRGFGIAAIITVLVLSYAIVTGLQGWIGYGAGDPETAGWIGLFSPMTLVDGVQVWAFGVETSAPAAPPDGAGPVFLIVTLAVVAACYAALIQRYRRVRL